MSRVPLGSRRVRRAATVVLGGMAAAHLAEAAVLRARLAGIGRLPAPDPSSGDALAATADRPAVVAVPGCEVDAATLAAAAQEIADGDLGVIDLVPGDLPASRALRLLRRIDPARLASDPFYAPGGAQEAVVLAPGVASRMGAPARPPRDRGDLVTRTVAAQRHAPAAAGLRVAPGLAATPLSGDDRWRELEELTAHLRPYSALAPALVGAETAHLAAMTAGLAVAPAAALAALLTWSAQAALVFAGPGGGEGAAIAPPHLARAGLARLAL
ncbi:MAG TPA: hypothetical protein VFI47_00105, partial [Acidimicrobiales bacterium]|nr:hypothetical protein [Acidimicrobiales bacterium]